MNWNDINRNVYIDSLRNPVRYWKPNTSPTTSVTYTTTVENIADLIAEINEIKNYNKRKDTKMFNSNPHDEIVDYKYEPIFKYDDKGNKTTYMKTTLCFRDGSETSVLAPAEKADKYYGFYACYAKHLAGNKVNDEAEYWIETLPKKIEKEHQAELMAIEEEQRIAERDKKRREKKRVRMEAIRRKEAYDAAKLAEEKYGVPMNFTYKCGNKD